MSSFLCRLSMAHRMKVVDPNGWEEELANKCALVRGGLVIQYNDRYHNENEVPAVGVFIAGENSKVYALSEPEAHDCWNPKHARLKDFLWGNPKLNDLVGRTHFNKRKNFRSFQQQHGDLVTRAMGDGLDFIEESLAPLGKITPIKNQPQSKEKAIETKVSCFRSSDRDNVIIELGMNPNLARKKIKCRIEPRGTVLSTSGGLSRDILKWELIGEDRNRKVSDGAFELKLEQNKPRKIEIESPVAKNWRTKWSVQVVGLAE